MAMPMLFQININVQNVFHMKKCVHAKPREAFLKPEKKNYNRLPMHKVRYQ